MRNKKSRKRGNHSKKKQNNRFRGEGDVVFHMSAEEATLAKMPYIDGYVCRGGIHGDTSYNRRREKENLRRLLREEGE